MYLETERLIINNLSLDDLEFLTDLDADPLVRKFIDGKIKTIRFGQQGKTGDKTMTKRAKSFKARHAKNIAKGKMSAAYWANKVKW